MAFSGKRVRQARELRGLTQTELAGKTRSSHGRSNVSQGLIADIERGFKDASHDVMASIAIQTRFPLSFFSKDPEVEFSLDSLLFRARASATRRQLMSACRYAELTYELFLGLSKRVTPLPLILPRLVGSDPHEAAQKTRIAMGISAGEPVGHLAYEIEKSGILVIALPVDLEKQDAFMHWAALDAPFIATIAGRPGDRSRFSMAHELGHIVLLHNRKFGTEEERLADQFAAEFLMPEVAMRREITIPVMLSRLAELKRTWKVSIQALARRAFDLNIISHRQYRYLFEQIGIKNYRTQEPVIVPPEQPRRLRQLAEQMYGHPLDHQRIALDFRLRTDLVAEIMEAYAGPREIATPRHNTNVVDFKRRR